ncbi:response regulator transcription factor [Niabella drilacis]|uniref:Two component transcriptional regulator, LuxR family n=1 Tax=Niabella drilacis (strain DSM 25811 / CCM 8410 / CCUG 62505 / LMG 26954 / E90) TaxID=1285928 RepID=A0A1G7A7C1_NIADE|nr:response regulator transcription factor [Niabella drilacis]SDE09766.1 two component transcriptional regulator, LuxR family [Niabella drilacis]
MIRVAIVEDNKDVLILLESLLQTEPDILHIGSITTGDAALKFIAEEQPDVVLMDIHLESQSGIDCVRQLKPICKKTEFVMCTAFDEDELVYESLRVGASSYLMKNNTPEFILNTIREVNEGKSPMSSDIARKIVRQMQQVQAPPEFNITARETEVLEQLSKGRTYQEISDQLYISIKTLKSHIYRIYEKLQVDNRVEAINKFYNIHNLYGR